MYCPAAFAMSRDDEVELIKRQPLATVVVRLPEPAGLVAHKLPLSVVSVWCGVDGADRVVLRGHCAAKNPLAHLLRYGAECLLVFDGDRAYVSPLFMGLPEPHKNAVPTYNYEVVQLRGIASLLDDKEEVRAIVTQLSNEQEAQFGARAWKVRTYFGF
jgi:transcriptional regulator